MRRVLCTGGAGFIGSHLVSVLSGHVDYLAVLDDLSTGKQSNIPGVRLWEGDIADPATVEAAALEARPDVIFHLAAQTSVRESMRDMIHDATVNVLGTVNVLRAANQHRSRIVFTSTGGAMYGEVPGEPATEKATVRSIAPYAVSKYSAETYLAAANRYKPRKDGHVMLRLANVYGPRQDPHGEAGVVAIFLNQLLTGERPVVYGDGTQERDFVYVADVVRAIWTAAENQEMSGVYNVGTGTACRIDRLLEECALATGRIPAPLYEPERPGDLRRSILSAKKLWEELGWVHMVDLDEGLTLTADWMRDQLAEAAA